MISTLKKNLNKKGFTLAELLIVVAIIAILVAIAIPVFGTSLNRAKEATEQANARACYAEGIVKCLETDGAAVSGTDVQIVSDGKTYTFTCGANGAGAKVTVTGTNVINGEYTNFGSVDGNTNT